MSGESPAPAVLAAGARRALEPSARWGSAWPRAAALLARQALEEALAKVWNGSAAAMRYCNVTAQLVGLPFYLDDADMALRVRQCWASLSNACHAHPYELAPTLAELSNWLDVVDEFINHVSTSQSGIPSVAPSPTR